MTNSYKDIAGIVQKRFQQLDSELEDLIWGSDPTVKDLALDPDDDLSEESDNSVYSLIYKMHLDYLDLYLTEGGEILAKEADTDSETS